MDFDPYSQNVSLRLADGVTPLSIPVPAINAINFESMAICLNYGAQIGAALLMLFVVLAMTPLAKLRRPSSALHIAGLVVCIVRTALLAAFFPSPFNDFYAFYAGDYSRVPTSDYEISVTANVFSLLLVVVVESALMNQAWTMVVLWPPWAKFAITFASMGVTLMTIGWRLAFAVIGCHAVWTVIPPANYLYVIHWTVITNAISICWFCALFNVKLVIHLFRNRGVLSRHSTALTPMEVLVMTNGILMIIPVIFAGLEWGHFTNFEAASLTLTSVALILPLGTLAARRVTRSGAINCCSSTTDSPSHSRNNNHPRHHHHHHHRQANGGGDGRGRDDGFGSHVFVDTASSTTPLKTAASFTTMSRSTTAGGAPLVSIQSRCEAGGGGKRERLDPFDLELGEIDSDDHHHHHQPIDGRRYRLDDVKTGVRVESAFEQHEERV